ncbi:MAG: T9SS type A sorting domain-containing protein [Bacteroidia bacterium]|nr:T9SS type A sorting domain-containing protein [Bacteroidia bacterium]
MKKLQTLIAFALTSVMANAQLSNGSFESYSSLPTCPSNYAITKANNWSGLKTTYNSACSSYTDVTSTEPDYFNSTSGGSSSCQTCNARTGTGLAHLEFRGYYPSSTAKSEFIYQSIGVTSGRSYTITAYVTNPNTVGFCMVNTSVGSSASAILGNVRSQVSSGLSYPTSTNVGGGWYKLELNWTAPSTTNYYLVIGSILFCNDANYSTLSEFCIDDISMMCAVNAGEDKSFTCSCCVGGCPLPTIGTSASGSSYSWSPTTGLTYPTSATTTANPSSSPKTYTLTVTGSDCTTNTDAVTVYKTFSTACCGPKSMISVPNDESKMFIYPNPNVDGIINIEFTTEAKERLVEIFDVTGKLILSKICTTTTTQIDLSDQSQGTYWIKTTTNGQQEIKTILKN